MSIVSPTFRKFIAAISSGRDRTPSARFAVMNRTRNRSLAARVEVATTSGQRSKGLLGRIGLDEGEGLWIVPCESVHTFGMRFAIDLVYLDKQHRIRKIRRNVPPWRISACLVAHSVLELAAGSVGEGDAQRGDTVEFIAVNSAPQV